MVLGIIVVLCTASKQEEVKVIALIPAEGIGMLKIGQSYEEVQSILGFGKLKTYEDYLEEELFSQQPGAMLECVIGFDYYIKYEYLITLPVEYIYFKNDTVNQIKVTSFPEYYRDLCEDVQTPDNLRFWEDEASMKDAYGNPAFDYDYDWYLLKSYFYPNKGIVFNFRENKCRTAHIIPQMSTEVIEKLKSGL